MAKNETSITPDKRKSMPPRGRNKRTLILDAIREQSALGLKESATPEECEKAWFKKLIEYALDGENKDSGLCMRLITERGWSALKPSSELVEFEFDIGGTATQQAIQILDAIASGKVPMDYGKEFIAAINSMTVIELNTDLKARIEKIEASLGVADQ